MNITSKSRYALKIMIDLAEHDTDSVVHRTDIAHRQGVPLDYMDHILSRLREAKLVASVRGRGGGYRLARVPGEISTLQIFHAVEDAWEPVACLGEQATCSIASVCSTRDTWSVISDAIGATLSGILLTDLVARRHQAAATAADRLADSGHAGSTGVPGQPVLAATVMENMVHECKAPRRRVGGARAE